MGTSASGKGRNSRSPLVPDHADTDPNSPLPPPAGQRFRGFRTEFGRAVSGGAGGSFTSALGKYARDSTGGSTIAARRFGPAYSAGGALFSLLQEMGGGGTGQNSIGVDFAALEGRSAGELIEAIAQALAPENADSDLVRVAVQEALGEVFPDFDPFGSGDISNDDLVAVLVEFLSRVIFLDIVNDAGDAWNHASDHKRTIDAENELFDIIHTAVDNHLAPALASGVETLTREQIERIERNAVEDIWSEWEGYE